MYFRIKAWWLAPDRGEPLGQMQHAASVVDTNSRDSQKGARHG